MLHTLRSPADVDPLHDYPKLAIGNLVQSRLTGSIGRVERADPATPTVRWEPSHATTVRRGLVTLLQVRRAPIR